MQAPLFSAGTGTPVPPFGGFADILGDLFSDLTMTGAYVAPNRSQAVLQIGEDEVELRVIGDNAWVRIGNHWTEEEVTDDLGLLTPEVVCRDVVQSTARSLEDLDFTRETVNGIDTDHYSLDEAGLQTLPGLPGAGAGDLPENFRVDVWVVHGGEWPVRMVIHSEDVDEHGNPAGLDLSLDFTNINDPSIKIESPATPAP
jgi:hypothetical protein